MQQANTKSVAAGAARLIVFWFVMLASSFSVLAQSVDPGIYFVADVATQFANLGWRPEPFGFASHDSFTSNITLDWHYQGIVRKNGPGTPYLFVSRNRDVLAGLVLVVRMGSRDTDGERLRSNRLLRDSPLFVLIPPAPGIDLTTPPDPRDLTVAVMRFEGTNPCDNQVEPLTWPAYLHPGGMQIVGNILAVPLSQPFDGNPTEHCIAFIDVSIPETPVLRSLFAPDPRGSEEFGVGQVALSPVVNPEGPGLRYLLLVAGANNKDVRLYRSLPTNSVDHSTDLASRQLAWEEIGSWTGDELDDPGEDTWPTNGSDSHQMFSFVRQQSLDGPLFLIGAFNNSAAWLPGGGETNWTCITFTSIGTALQDRFLTPSSAST